MREPPESEATSRYVNAKSSAVYYQLPLPPPPPPPPEKPPPPKELPPPKPVPPAPLEEATGVAADVRLLVRKEVLKAAIW
jgi:hypothetical protein